MAEYIIEPDSPAMTKSIASALDGVDHAFEVTT